MPTVNVQFSDASKTKIVSAFCGPQDPEFYPNQGEIDSDDARYVSFIAEIRDAGLPIFPVVS
jgi:hypothetical protein